MLQSLTLVLEGTNVAQPITFEQGESVTLTLSFVDAEGQAVAVDGAIVFTAKRHASSTDPDISRQADVGEGITLTLVGDDTKALRAGVLYYEFTYLPTAGGSYNVLPVSKLTLTRALYTDGQEVTVPASAAPLGQGIQGEQGPPGATTADGVTYAATTPSDWNGTAPTTVADAIDRIATALSTLNQKP